MNEQTKQQKLYICNEVKGKIQGEIIHIHACDILELKQKLENNFVDVIGKYDLFKSSHGKIYEVYEENKPYNILFLVQEYKI